MLSEAQRFELRKARFERERLNPEKFKAERKRIAHPGGKISHNKEEALIKYLKRLERQGKKLTAQQATALRVIRKEKRIKDDDDKEEMKKEAGLSTKAAPLIQDDSDLLLERARKSSSGALRLLAEFLDTFTRKMKKFGPPNAKGLMRFFASLITAWKKKRGVLSVRENQSIRRLSESCCWDHTRNAPLAGSRTPPSPSKVSAIFLEHIRRAIESNSDVSLLTKKMKGLGVVSSATTGAHQVGRQQRQSSKVGERSGLWVGKKGRSDEAPWRRFRAAGKDGP